jgi:hypothetical protein
MHEIVWVRQDRTMKKEKKERKDNERSATEGG